MITRNIRLSGKTQRICIKGKSTNSSTITSIVVEDAAGNITSVINVSDDGKSVSLKSGQFIDVLKVKGVVDKNRTRNK